MKGESAHDYHSYIQYWVLTLTAKPTRRLLKDESLDGSDTLYRVLILTTNFYNLHQTLA